MCIWIPISGLFNGWIWEPYTDTLAVGPHFRASAPPSRRAPPWKCSLHFATTVIGALRMWRQFINKALGLPCPAVADMWVEYGSRQEGRSRARGLGGAVMSEGVTFLVNAKQSHTAATNNCLCCGFRRGVNGIGTEERVKCKCVFPLWLTRAVSLLPPAGVPQ